MLLHGLFAGQSRTQPGCGHAQISATSVLLQLALQLRTLVKVGPYVIPDMGRAMFCALQDMY